MKPRRRVAWAALGIAILPRFLFCLPLIPGAVLRVAADFVTSHDDEDDEDEDDDDDSR